MKNIIPALFIFMGLTFLLVSTVFYPSITQLLESVQGLNSKSIPDFWDLSWVLKIVKIIFLIVGVFLIIFGIAAFRMKKLFH
jgi:hypothetical protein